MGAKLQSSMEIKIASLINVQIAIPSTSLPNTCGMAILSILLSYLAQRNG